MSNDIAADFNAVFIKHKIDLGAIAFVKDGKGRLLRHGDPSDVLALLKVLVESDLLQTANSKSL